MVIDQRIMGALSTIADKHPTYGFRKMFYCLRLQAIRRPEYDWNHKRVYRLYCLMGLNLRRKRKVMLPKRSPHPLAVPEQADEVWSMDFMSDSLYNGRRFRAFTLIDHHNREALWIKTAYSISSKEVVDILDWLVGERKIPKAIRLDNGPEFRSARLTEWAKQKGIELDYIEPGKPTQNAFIERFNRTYRTEVLDAYLFKSIKEVRDLTEQWIVHYNERRPHESLGHKTPAMVA